MSDDNSRVLKPTKFSVAKPDTPQHGPDQFGQQYNADDDLSKWSDLTPALSRKLHTRADTDISPRSLHHTLGIKHSQASPGDHNHDGTTSKLIGPLEMDPTPGNEGLTRAVWTIPVAATVADIVGLLHEFVEFREV